MDELLRKLLEAEILSEESRAELQTAFADLREKAIVEAKELAIEETTADVTAKVTAQLNEQWISEREMFIEAIDARVTELVTEEIKDLQHDVENFRDLEIEYAEKIVEAKGEMHTIYKADMDQLIGKMDKFMEIKLIAEVAEFKQDIVEVRKQQFGKNIFEAFVKEFKTHYAEDGSTESRLVETEKRLSDTADALEKSERKVSNMNRKSNLARVLQPLKGRTREVMEAILKNVDTSMLNEAYSTYIGRVLKETSDEISDDVSEKETRVLAESVGSKDSRAIIRTGDLTDLLEDTAAIAESDVVSATISADEKSRLRRIAGME